MKNSSWFKKESGFRNGSRMFDEKLTILEFKYLLNKKWKKQAVKRTRTKNSYRRVIYFFGPCEVRNKADFQILEHSSSRTVKQKEHKKT